MQGQGGVVGQARDLIDGDAQAFVVVGGFVPIGQELAFQSVGSDHAKCTLQGDYKIGNASASEIESMNKYIIELKNNDDACKLVDDIIRTDFPNAIMWITPVCKKRNHKVEEVRQKLLNYSNDRDLGILALNAIMLLKTL